MEAYNFAIKLPAPALFKSVGFAVLSAGTAPAFGVGGRTAGSAGRGCPGLE